MAYLRLNRMYKVYPNGVKAVNDFSIDIEDKEFIVFVGPSGCGKSTTLRMIAGLEEITAGELFLEDKLINDVEPEDRDIAMVFQNYALYPHMTVYDNMAFGLKNRKVKDHIIREKINEAVKILDLEGYLQKKPREMSGGQAQRVALGRAIVRNPKVFLFDEPLSNLDAKLRASMRSEITKLHKKLETTFIYVTHDQVEAMTMGTRIVVMKDGYVQQIDEPMNLYYNPINKFVAGFIGTPQMNFFNIKLKRNKNDVILQFSEKATYKLPFEQLAKIDDKYLAGEVEVTLGVRPEHFILSKKKTGLSITVNFFEQLGDEIIIYGDLEQEGTDFIISDDSNSIIVKGSEDDKVAIGDVIHLAIKDEKFHLFDQETEVSILQQVPHFSTVSGTVSGNKLKMFNSNIKLQPAVLKKVASHKDIKIDIPPHAFVPGKDFALPIDKIEQIGDVHLAHLKDGDKFVFAIVDQKVKAGTDYKFNIPFEKVNIRSGDDDLLTPIDTTASLTGKLVRERVRDGRRRVTNYYFELGGEKFLIDEDRAHKLITIDGRASFKKDYRFSAQDNALNINNNGEIAANIVETYDYGHVVFAKLNINNEAFVVQLPKDVTDLDNIKLSFDINNFEVWHEDLDFRII